MKLFVWLLLLTPAIPGLSQKFSFNQGGTSAHDYYEALPYEMLNGKLFIYVKLAGKKHKFLFDTGATVAISKELAATLPGTELYKDLLMDAVGNKDSITVINIDGLQLGNLVFDHIPALPVIPEFYKCWGVEGVIGSNLLRNSIVHIDPAAQTIVLTDQLDKLPLQNKQAIPMITNEGPQSDPKIKIWFNAKTSGIFVFDSGESGFLRFTEEYMVALKKTKAYDLVWKGYGGHTVSYLGTEKNADKYLLKFPAVTVADATFENLTVETTRTGSSAIGTRLLDYGSVTLDYMHGKFYYSTANPIADINEKQWPFQFTINGDQLAIGEVWADGHTDVRPGQQVLAVNDVAYEHISLCDLITKKPILSGKDSVTITVKEENGRIRKVQLSKE